MTIEEHLRVAEYHATEAAKLAARSRRAVEVGKMGAFRILSLISLIESAGEAVLRELNPPTRGKR